MYPPRETPLMIRDRLIRYASRLRFPKLLTLTVALFLADLIIPDFIPLVDEILLGLVAAMLATLRDKRQVRDK
jgi:hypothetical protein